MVIETLTVQVQNIVLISSKNFIFYVSIKTCFVFNTGQKKKSNSWKKIYRKRQNLLI